MKNKFITIGGTFALILAMGTTAFATTTPSKVESPSLDIMVQKSNTSDYSNRVSGYWMMMDENGNFLDREDYEARLDIAIKEGDIRAEDKDYYLNMYDACNGYNTSRFNNNRMNRGCGR